MRNPTRRTLKLWLPLFACALVLVLPGAGWAQSGGDPRNPELTTLTPWARVQYIRGGPCRTQIGQESFAAPLGDLNGDGITDFVVTFVDCGAPGVPEHQLPPTFQYIFLGSPEPKGLPIGPVDSLRLSETFAKVWYITSGDFDGDGAIDIVTRTVVEGEFNGSVAGHLVVWWGEPGGHFSIDDTTRLQNGTHAWLGAVRALQPSADFDGDGVDDLMVSANAGVRDQKPVPVPRLQSYATRRGERWGRNGFTRSPGWVWWQAPVSAEPKVEYVDQDCDGARDLVFHSIDPIDIAVASVLYGRTGRDFDTSDFESVTLTGPDVGHYQTSVQFGDFTGDGIVDLACGGGSNYDEISIYAGQPGQRLMALYSGGAEPRSPSRPFDTPWAILDGPSVFSDFFIGSGHYPLASPGDLNEDGYDDVIAETNYGLILYCGGPDMDSLFDAVIPPRYMPTRLGYVDGSSHWSLASFDDAYLYLFHSDSSINSDSYLKRALPHQPGQRCRSVSGGVTPHPRDGAATLILLSPSSNAVATPAGTREIAVYDVRGELVQRTMSSGVDLGDVRLEMTTPGVYFMVGSGREGEVWRKRLLLFHD